METKNETKNNTQIFFWGSYIVLLGVSIPHSAYVFASFTDNSFNYIRHIIAHFIDD